MSAFNEHARQALLLAGVPETVIDTTSAESYLIDFADAKHCQLFIRSAVDILMYTLVCAAQGKDEVFCKKEMTRLFASASNIHGLNDPTVVAGVAEFIEHIQSTGPGMGSDPQQVADFMRDRISELAPAYGRRPTELEALSSVLARVFFEKFQYAKNISTGIKQYEELFKMALLADKLGLALEDVDDNPLKALISCPPGGMEKHLSELYEYVYAKLIPLIPEERRMAVEITRLAEPQQGLAILLGSYETMATTFRVPISDYNAVLDKVFGADFIARADAFVEQNMAIAEKKEDTLFSGTLLNKPFSQLPNTDKGVSDGRQN